MKYSALVFATAILSIQTASALTLSIAERGAVSDASTMNTRAIQAAVDECAAKGGGTVLVPAGVWLTGSVGLKSSVCLRLEAGAVLRASDRIEDYPTNGFRHLEMGDTRSLLWALNQSDISICGEGTIELSDRPFFDWHRLRTGLPRQKDALLQDWQRDQCVVTAGNRPNQPIFFHACHRVRIEDVTIKNSPCWTVTFSCSDDIQVHGIRIDNNLQVPNNDGIHFSGSKNIVVSDCIIRGGDDSLAFTGITDPDSVCEHIAVANCILSSRSAGVRLGHLSGKVRDVVLSNLVIRESNRGFAVQAGNGGWVENVLINNVVVETENVCGRLVGQRRTGCDLRGELPAGPYPRHHDQPPSRTYGKQHPDCRTGSQCQRHRVRRRGFDLWNQCERPIIRRRIGPGPGAVASFSNGCTLDTLGLRQQRERS